jgi:hypothetical protein
VAAAVLLVTLVEAMIKVLQDREAAEAVVLAVQTEEL